MLQCGCGSDSIKTGVCCSVGVAVIVLRLVCVAQCGCGNDSTKTGVCCSVGVAVIVLSLVCVAVWVWQ